ncbi:MAG: ABC transporter ATP-binding protein [Verrucomicrobia bacterium]|nr:ABC transporter ATP-binding protein [Verrucomicrobiota bacterium]
MVDAVVKVNDVAKTFPGGVVAVSGLDLEIPRGAVYGLIGRNGAGKTTTLKLLLGLLRPDHGTAQVFGRDLWRAGREVRSRIAYVSQAPQLYGWMTLGELCRYTAYFYPAWDGDYARQLARRWALDWDRPVGRLSGGEQRKAATLLAFASRPALLVLDEPAANLDPIARREMIQELLEVITQRDECTVLLSTHQVGDLERMTEYVGFMDRGRLTMTERLEDLQQRFRRVQVVFPGAAPPPGFVVPGAVRYQVAGPVVTAIVRQTSEAELDGVRALPGARLNLFQLGLEEMFIELFGRSDREMILSQPASAEEPSEEPASNIISLRRS